MCQWYAYPNRGTSGYRSSLFIRVEADKPTREMVAGSMRELTSTLMGLKPELELFPVGTLSR